MEPFQIKELESPNMLEKLLKKEHPANFAIEINNLLATIDFENTPPDYIDQLKTKYKVGKYSGQLSAGINSLLANFISHYLGANGKFQCKSEALAFSNFLGVDPEVFESVFSKIAEVKIKKRMLDLVSDALITDDEETEVLSWQTIFGMTKQQIEEITNPVLQEILNTKVNEITEDERISPQEEQSILELANNLRSTLNVTPETQNQIDFMKKLWNIENGDLPHLETGIILQKSEFCVFYETVDYLEKRKVTTGYNYGGPAFRIKIAKGIYYRAGNVRGSRQTEDVLTKLDTGTFYITNKRVLFYGTLGNKTIRYNQIIDFEVYSDGLRISKATGKDAVFSFEEDTQLAGAYLARCISESE